MKVAGFVLATAVVCCLAGPVQANDVLHNPDWSITISDYGYSDELLDKAFGREGREYLSGEWAAAVDYTVGATAKGPTWLEPNFIYPNWTTNSDFGVTSSITMGPLNGDGLPTASSTIENSDLRIVIDYEMLDTSTGIEQGAHAAGAANPGTSLTSSRYILKQTYEITNKSLTDTITQLQLFQFLHGLNSEVALYDNRNYGGSYAGYQYDTFLSGTDDWWSEEEDYIDVVTFHSSVEPSAWESGYYGIEGTDSRTVGKPGTGVHLSVEGDSLNGTDYFDPSSPEHWVSGAQRYDLVNLAPEASTSFDVLLSVSTEVIPEPATLGLLVVGGLALLKRRR